MAILKLNILSDEVIMSFHGLIMKLENNFTFFLKRKMITCKFSITNFYFLHDNFVKIIKSEIKNLQT